MLLTALPEFDVTSDEFRTDPAGSIQWDRYPGGIARSARGLELLSYEAVTEAFRSPELRNATKAKMAAMGFTEGPVYDALTGMTTSTEGPDHKRMRRAFAPWFIADNVEGFRGEIRATIDEWMEQNSEGTVDFASEIGRKLPSMVFTQLVGADSSEADFISHSSAEILKAFMYRPEMHDRVERATLAAIDWIHALIERKLSDPGADVTSALLEQERDGAISRKDTLNILTTLLIASVDSTSGQMACNIDALANNKDQWKILKEHPEAVHTAVSELYRYKAGVMTMSRSSEQDLVLRGIEIKAGEPVFLCGFAANNDPAVYEKPRELDVLNVRGIPPVSFGNGRHSCVGRIVATIEQEEMLSAMLRHWDDFEVAEAEWFGAPFQLGATTYKLHVTRA